MNHSRRILLLAAVLGALTVALGAFGAHGLRQTLEGRAHEAGTPDGVELWCTATQYALVHAAALVGLAGFVARENPWKLLRVAAVCWFAGALVFSGTLMAMALGGPKWLGAITPVGGLGLIAGWALIAVSLLRKPRGVGAEARRQESPQRAYSGDRPQRDDRRRNDRRRR